MEKELKKSDIKKRLNRIEGQIRGIQKMVDNDQCCNDILIQIAAVRAAINKVGGMILENYTKSCLKSTVMDKDGLESIDDLIDLVVKFMK